MQLIRNLGNDPEVRIMQNGGRVVTLSIATSESWKDRSSGERKQRTEWHRVVIFSEGLGEIVGKFLAKGAKVFIKGALRTRKWQDQSGADRYSTEIHLTQYNGIADLPRCQEGRRALLRTACNARADQRQRLHDAEVRRRDPVRAVLAVNTRRRRPSGRRPSVPSRDISGPCVACGGVTRWVLAREIIHDTRDNQRRRAFMPHERPDLAAGGHQHSRALIAVYIILGMLYENPIHLLTEWAPCWSCRCSGSACT